PFTSGAGASGPGAGDAPASGRRGLGPPSGGLWSWVGGATSVGGGTSRKRATAWAHLGSARQGAPRSGRRRAASSGSSPRLTACTRAWQAAQLSTWPATASRSAPDRSPAAKAASFSRAGQVGNPIARLLVEQVAKLFPQPFAHARSVNVNGAETHPQLGSHVRGRAVLHGHPQESLPRPLRKLVLQQRQGATAEALQLPRRRGGRRSATLRLGELRQPFLGRGAARGGDSAPFLLLEVADLVVGDRPQPTAEGVAGAVAAEVGDL